MTGAVFVKNYPAPVWSRREILRYASCGEADERTKALLEECMAESEPVLCYKVCYARFPLEVCGDELLLGFARTSSKGLRKNLASCREIVLFAATVGLGTERLAARYAHIAPAKSLLFDAIGTERVEALCDAFCGEIREKTEAAGGFTRPRFSPGYGDLPLSLQKDIFRVLSPEKHIGASLRESLIISPAKTVTAVVGIGKNN